MKITTIHMGDNTKFDIEFEKKEPEESLKVYDKKSNNLNNGVIVFDNPPIIIGKGSIVGKKEKDGPLGKYFEHVATDEYFGKKNYKRFEEEEVAILESSISIAIKDSKKSKDDLQLLVCGDLMNQLTTSNYTARNFGIPFFGIYSACSSFSQSLLFAAAMINANYYDNVACAVSSHFASAERQFRYPLEYGAQKPPYSQWTVTGAGCIILASFSKEKQSGVHITKACVGKVIDMGTKDMSNMGAAMAPAFFSTLMHFFECTKTTEKDYDLIVSGDLGKLGSDIARTLASEQGIILGQNYIDCGAIIYDNTQNAYQGGSGCGCSATVINSYIIPKIEEGVWNKVLYLATGALMSPQSCFQGESIPCISHCVLFERIAR